jgi:hypothetical protein
MVRIQVACVAAVYLTYDIVGSAAADSSYLFDEVCYVAGGSVRYFRTDIDNHFECSKNRSAPL